MIPKLLFIAGVVLLFLIPSSIATTPAISNVYYTEYPTECYIHWETNITSSNRVNYSVNANLSGGTYTAWTNNTTEPHILLTGLSRTTTYYYQVYSVNDGDSSNSSIASFTTLANRGGFTKYFDRMFQVNDLDGWGVTESTTTTYEDEVGAYLFWTMIISMPFLAMIIRQQSIAIPSVIGLLGAVILLPLLPPEHNLPIKVMLAISITGLIWHLFISRR